MNCLKRYREGLDRFLLDFKLVFKIIVWKVKIRILIFFNKFGGKIIFEGRVGI